jgi:HD superfamily phosphodiesterase
MKKIEEFAMKKYAGFSDTHNMKGHIDIVVKNVELIAQKEGGDIGICKAAALLHDVGYVQDHKEHAKYSAIMTGEFLRGLGLDEGTVERVIACVEYHGWRDFNERATLEAKIVGDADRLELFGPWGIIRVFEDNLTNIKMSINEALAHTEDLTEKAFKSLHTKTAKEMARPLYENSREFFRLLKRQRGF